jgi:gas vesicle protein
MNNERNDDSSGIGGQRPGPNGDDNALPMRNVTELADDLKRQASDIAQDVTRQVKAQASQLTENAKSAATGAGDKLRSAAEDQKNAGADFVSGFAGAVRRAAGEFDEQMPQAGDYIRRVAEQIDGASNALRQRDLGELLEGAKDFARRQPTAFLGATVLAGFAVTRFLKSSKSASPTRESAAPAFQSENARHLADAAGKLPQEQRM